MQNANSYFVHHGQERPVNGQGMEKLSAEQRFARSQAVAERLKRQQSGLAHAHRGQVKGRFPLWAYVVSAAAALGFLYAQSLFL